MKFSEDSKDPRFTEHQDNVKAFNAEFDTLMDKYGLKGIVLGVTSGTKTDDGVACAAFANGHMKDSTLEQKRAMVEIIDRSMEDIFEKIKFRVMMETLAKKLGIDPDKMKEENCDCDDCRDDSTASEDTSEPQEEYEEDPAHQVARENCEAIQRDDRE